MKNNKNIYLHIGSGKTGSTSLQKYLYANNSYLDKYDYIYPGPYSDVKNGQYKNADCIINRLINNEDINSILTEYISKYPKKNIILSDEAFLHRYDDNQILLHQLRNINPQLKVTIIIYYRKIIEFMVKLESKK